MRYLHKTLYHFLKTESSTFQPIFCRCKYYRELGVMSSSPCDFLLQLGDTGYVKQYSKVNGGLHAILVQLFLQRLLQVDPSLLVLLIVVPKTEICDLKSKTKQEHTIKL